MGIYQGEFFSLIHILKLDKYLCIIKSNLSLIKLKSKMFTSLAEVLNCETDMIELLKLYLFKVLTRIEVLYCLYLVLMSKMFS